MSSLNQTLLLKSIKSRHFRKFITGSAEILLYWSIVGKAQGVKKEIQKNKYYISAALLSSLNENYNAGNISDYAINRFLSSLLSPNYFANPKKAKAKAAFKEKYGVFPPAFLTISPTNKCNLNCEGCYAESGSMKNEKLPYEVLSKAVKESRDSFGGSFIVISGGEPFLYEDGGKTLFDLWKEYDDMYFMVYTNGTLINKDTASKLAELGNVSPAISIEGFGVETDKRRGYGVHKSILSAFKTLREHKVPFGVSVTATAQNASILLDDSFYDLYFGKAGALYMWQFHLMPIGRGAESHKNLISPEQRINLYAKWKQILQSKKYLVADFWNSGVLANGCIAYGREGGYIYIDWNGNIMPCVFIPYFVDNINDLYSNGKTLSDALFSDFFINGRNWQKSYSFTENPKNLLLPCSIRDHYDNFRKNIVTKGVKPENEEAGKALFSQSYFQMMGDFDRELKERADAIWKQEYGGEIS
ncbi:MAG TPA: radical SAM protein [Candidatus Nanoarchaeia archaeon]|nr:radical SAM protein [Candidatus Nanoarchaeia archaeon]